MQALKQKRTEFERQALVHTDSLFGAAYRLTRNPRDAEDLVQDSLLRAYRFWDSFQQDSNCKAWLLRIVTNTFINEYQRKKRSREVLDAASAEQDATDGVLVQAHASRQAVPGPGDARAERLDDVQRALEQLPEDFRTAVVLCDMQGLSYKEIAEIMECPVGTVMSRLFRGRKLLAAGAPRVRGVRGLRQTNHHHPEPEVRDDRSGEVPYCQSSAGRQVAMSLCESIDTLAMAYLDDELASEERRELDTHLTECVSCRAEIDGARARSIADPDVARRAAGHRHDADAHGEVRSTSRIARARPKRRRLSASGCRRSFCRVARCSQRRPRSWCSSAST